MAENRGFFEEAGSRSRVKSAIVSKYFGAWSGVVKGAARRRGSNIAYIDLFAGKGRYDDDTPSTPLLVLQKAIDNPDLQQMLVTIFNDADQDCAASLKEEIYEDHHPGRRYTSKNYREVLLALERQGRIIVNPPANKRRKGTFGDNTRITFP